MCDQIVENPAFNYLLPKIRLFLEPNPLKIWEIAAMGLGEPISDVRR